MKFNTKYVLAILFTLSALSTGMTNNLIMFITYRIIGGPGIGLASSISPVYIAEVSPKTVLGKFVSINQLNIVIGILAAQFINFLIAEEVPDDATHAFIVQSWNGQMGWRWMFWAEMAPALKFLILAFLIPESPRFLIKLKKENLAMKTLEKI